MLFNIILFTSIFSTTLTIVFLIPENFSAPLNTVMFIAASLLPYVTVVFFSWELREHDKPLKVLLGIVSALFITGMAGFIYNAYAIAFFLHLFLMTCAAATGIKYREDHSLYQEKKPCQK